MLRCRGGRTTLVRADESGPHILVVDDVEMHRRLIEILMLSEGYSVVLAGTGKEALDRVAEHLPDVIVLDLALPDMHGSELIARLHADGLDIPVLIVTGDSTPPSRIATLQAAEYLTKPYDVDALIKAVAQLVRGPAQQHGEPA
jgi:CheY-like chemotaxis protein